MTQTSTEQPELLPCPLCGGDVKHEVWSDRSFHKVECQDCGLDVDYCNSYAELAAFWNRRAPAAQAQRVALTPVYPPGLTSFNAKLSFNNGWKHCEAAHGITQEKQG
jgi:Lar family restriction alleviation protein